MSSTSPFYTPGWFDIEKKPNLEEERKDIEKSNALLTEEEDKVELEIKRIEALLEEQSKTNSTDYELEEELEELEERREDLEDMRINLNTMVEALQTRQSSYPTEDETF